MKPNLTAALRAALTTFLFLVVVALVVAVFIAPFIAYIVYGASLQFLAALIVFIYVLLVALHKHIGESSELS